MNLFSQIESILFVASKPLTVRQIARAVSKNETEVGEALATLRRKYETDSSGLRLVENGAAVELGTAPENSEVIAMFIKDETAGELTRAQLETLTVIAYRGPVTRPELEQIRGVNCALILRHLLMRGYIEEEEASDSLTTLYRLSLEALRHLGITRLEALPDYDTLHAHEYIEAIIKREEATPGDV